MVLAICIFPCVFSFRHGARPVSTKYIFWLAMHHKPLCVCTVDTRRAACRKQISTIYEKHTIGNQSWFWQFAFFPYLSLPRRGTPRLYEIHFLVGNALQSLCARKVETRRAEAAEKVAVFRMAFNKNDL